MIVQRLIELSLGNIGVSNLQPEEYQSALDRLNLVISDFPFWDEAEMPIPYFTALSQEIYLPGYYLKIFEHALSAAEGTSYGIPASDIQYHELKTKQLTDKLVFRHSEAMVVNPTTFVV